MRSLQRLAVMMAMVVLVMWSVAPECAAEDHAASDAATLQVDQDNLDLGPIVSGTTAVAVFTFHNQSQRDIKIIRAKPS